MNEGEGVTVTVGDSDTAGVEVGEDEAGLAVTVLVLVGVSAPELLGVRERERVTDRLPVRVVEMDDVREFEADWLALGVSVGVGVELAGVTIWYNSRPKKDEVAAKYSVVPIITKLPGELEGVPA